MSLPNQNQIKRYADFRKRANFSPRSVYQHKTQLWEYIPIHPFADEADLLLKLQLRPSQCTHVDAWWCVGDDATLLESFADPSLPSHSYWVKPTKHSIGWVYCVAAFSSEIVTRALFEDAMLRFYEAGFPTASKFRLRPKQAPVFL